MPEIRTGTARFDGMEMDYISFGEQKNAFVILPGIDVKSIIPSAQAIESAYRDFAEHYTVYVFDRRRDMPEDYSVRDMARDTAAAMRSLGIARADIFGASQGGMIAQYLASDCPELVNAMVLGSTAARPNDTLLATLDRWISLAQQRDVPALTADFIDNLYSENTVGKYRDVLLHMNDNVGDEDIRRFIIQARSIDGFDAYSHLAAVSCPVLVIGVEGDRVITADASVEIAERLGCELYLYGAEYGHCVFDEAPDYRERMLRFFLQH